MLLILTCPIHLSDELSLMNSELKCLTCNSVIGIIKNSSPIKIDFTNNFSSGLLDSFKPHKKDIAKWTNWREANLKFLLEMGIKPGIVLDIGAGAGVFHPFLNLPQLISIDFTDYPVTNIITDLKQNIPIKSATIDSIIMTNLLEHLYDHSVIIEARRLLKKGSHLYITVPFLLDVHQVPYDYHRYTYIYLTDILQKNGFEVEKILPLGDFFTFKQLVFHYFKFITPENLLAKVLWRFQKIINTLLERFIPMNYRLDYTGGYMIRAKKNNS